MDQRRIQITVDGRTAVFGPGLPEIVVGRERSCFIRPLGPTIGDRHLVLRHAEDGWTVEALPEQRVYHEGRPVERLKVDRALRLQLGELGNGSELEVKPGEDDAGRFATADFGTLARTARERSAAGRRHPIDGDVMRVGRDPDSDLVVDDLLVSRRHAELRRRADGSIEVVDLDSFNGTFVNGHRVDRVVLEEHDVVMVGAHSYRLAGGVLEEEVDTGEIAFAAANLTVRLPTGQLLVDDVEFSLDARTMLGIVGPSGAGKSTLVKALSGLVVATEGDVLYDHASLYASYEALRRRIGYVPQDDIVHTDLTVRRALEYAADLRFPPDVERAERLRRVEEVMAELDLSNREGVRIASLSGGQRKRVNVALELLTKPSLLFLDEATSGLDPHFERALMELCRQLADGGRTVIVVTHTMQSLRLCDRLLIMARDGQMAYFGPPQLAAAYFDRADLADVFRTFSDDRVTSWKDRYREHEYYEHYVRREAAPAEREEAETGSAELRAPHVRRGWWRQFATLSRRYAAVLAADRRNLTLMLLQAPVLGLLMLAALPSHQLTPAPPSEFRLISQASLVLLVVVLGTTWLGLSNAIREIAKELPIYRRERVAGLSVSAYVASKVAVLGVVTIVQSAVLVALATSRQGSGGDGALTGWPFGELMVVSALAGLAAMAMGLFISAAAGTTDRAVTVLPIVLVLLLVLALGSVFPQIGKRPVLNQLGYVASTQWGFAGMASTVDLNDLQAVTGVLTRVDSVKVDDPAPLFRAAFSRHEPKLSSRVRRGVATNVPEERCAGAGSRAADGSVRQESATRKTGACPSCGGRFRLDGEARLADHAPATTLPGPIRGRLARVRPIWVTTRGGDETYSVRMDEPAERGPTLADVVERLADFGPIQMWSFVFDGNKFKGEILPELERLKKERVIRLIDLLVVRKDSTGAITTLTSTDLDWEEAASFGALIGALIGWGSGGTDGLTSGAIAGASELADGHLFDENSRRALADSVPPNSTAAVALVEHVWAQPLQAAIGRARGVELTNEWLKVDDLIARGISMADSEQSD